MGRAASAQGRVHLVSGTIAAPDFGTYLGIIAALQTPELKAVLETIPWNWESSQFPSDASNYFKGSFDKGGEMREVVAVAAPRMGMTASSVASMKLIAAFRPRYLVMGWDCCRNKGPL